MSDNDGRVSVELLNIERESCDRIRSDNDRLRAINAVLLDAVREAQEFLGGLIFDKEIEGGEGMPLRKQLADAIAKATGES